MNLNNVLIDSSNAGEVLKELRKNKDYNGLFTPKTEICPDNYFLSGIDRAAFYYGIGLEPHPAMRNNKKFGKYHTLSRLRFKFRNTKWQDDPILSWLMPAIDECLKQLRPCDITHHVDLIDEKLEKFINYKRIYRYNGQMFSTKKEVKSYDPFKVVDCFIIRRRIYPNAKCKKNEEIPAVVGLYYYDHNTERLFKCVGIDQDAKLGKFQKVKKEYKYENIIIPETGCVYLENKDGRQLKYIWNPETNEFRTWNGKPAFTEEEIIENMENKKMMGLDEAE